MVRVKGAPAIPPVAAPSSSSSSSGCGRGLPRGVSRSPEEVFRLARKWFGAEIMEQEFIMPMGYRDTGHLESLARMGRKRLAAPVEGAAPPTSNDPLGRVDPLAFVPDELIIRDFLSKLTPAELNAHSLEHGTLLHLAAQLDRAGDVAGYPDRSDPDAQKNVCKWLLESPDFQPSIGTTDRHGQTALHVAVSVAFRLGPKFHSEFIRSSDWTCDEFPARRAVAALLENKQWTDVNLNRKTTNDMKTALCRAFSASNRRRSDRICVRIDYGSASDGKLGTVMWTQDTTDVLDKLLAHSGLSLDELFDEDSLDLRDFMLNDVKCIAHAPLVKKILESKTVARDVKMKWLKKMGLDQGETMKWLNPWPAHTFDKRCLEVVNAFTGVSSSPRPAKKKQRKN
ncbi:unnamed protein product [Amoebophrya sp. A25]|nr:unnamed protein product [Amoebophrya sp. A25]|eukprot:GSA25T00026472001.1